MRRHKNLLQYHLQSALELAREDRQSMVEYFATLALMENSGSGDTTEQKKTAA